MKTSRRVIPRRGSSHSAEYEPLTGPDIATEMQDGAIIQDECDGDDNISEVPFSWFDYGVFGFVGMAMLWAWNMFIAASQYFTFRLQGSQWIVTNFQPTILTVSTLTSLAVVLVLAKIQRRASYPFRINAGLLINTVAFSLLTCSTVAFLHVSARAYFAFVLTMVAAASVATGLLQNGALAFAASFGRPEYMQALVTGQSVAGVLPPLSAMLSVLVFPAARDRQSSHLSTDGPLAGAGGGTTSAFVYFLAAVVISVVAMGAMVPLAAHHRRSVGYHSLGQNAADGPLDGSGNGNDSADQLPANAHGARRVVPMRVLFSKLRWLASGITLVFATTMFFPVFTNKIRSVQEPKESWVGGLFAPEAFIPLAVFFWNLGDFGGRLSTAMFQLSSDPSSSSPSSSWSVTRRPRLLFHLAVLRILQVPLYLLCNIGNRGAVISSDLFYLVVVQLPFGFSNGWLCSKLMTSAGGWVDEDEREAAGGFMGLCLIFGLTAGSLLSFLAAGV